MADVTQILQHITTGDRQAADKLLSLAYEELRRVADARMATEPEDQTLQATSLVHEAYLRLVDVPDMQSWQSRGHFFRAASEAMRRILVERARRKARSKHGGGVKRVEFLDQLAETIGPSGEILAVNEALADLEQEDPQAAEVVKLRFFVGMTMAETAEALGLSERTVYRDWRYARAWLFRRLGHSDALPK